MMGHFWTWVGIGVFVFQVLFITCWVNPRADREFYRKLEEDRKNGCAKY